MTKVTAEDGAKFALPLVGRFFYFVVELHPNVAYNVVCDKQSEGFFAARLDGVPEGWPDAWVVMKLSSRFRTKSGGVAFVDFNQVQSMCYR